MLQASLPVWVLCMVGLYSASLVGQSDQTSQILLKDPELTGWQVMVRGTGKVAVDDQDFFVWEDSVLHVLPTSEAGSYQQFAALVSDSTYSRYRLHLEYRWGEKKFAPRDDAVRDGGILFHIPDTTTFWPTSVECQIQEGDTGDAWLIGTRATSTVNPDRNNYSEEGELQVRTGRRFTRFPRSFSWERPGWNEVDLEVDGTRAVFFVNGHHVNSLTDIQVAAGEDEWIPLNGGYIGLQAEGAELFYRNLRIESLE